MLIYVLVNDEGEILNHFFVLSNFNKAYQITRRYYKTILKFEHYFLMKTTDICFRQTILTRFDTLSTKESFCKSWRLFLEGNAESQRFFLSFFLLLLMLLVPSFILCDESECRVFSHRLLWSLSLTLRLLFDLNFYVNASSFSFFLCYVCCVLSIIVMSAFLG